MVPHVCAIITPYLQILYIYIHTTIYIYIYIYVHHWYYIMYQLVVCPPWIILKMALCCSGGSPQGARQGSTSWWGKTDCFSIFWQLWWGRRCFQTPFNHWISGVPPPYWTTDVETMTWHSFGTEPLWPYRTAVPGFSKSDASRFSWSEPVRFHFERGSPNLPKSCCLSEKVVECFNILGKIEEPRCCCLLIILLLACSANT